MSDPFPPPAPGHSQGRCQARGLVLFTRMRSMQVAPCKVGGLEAKAHPVGRCHHWPGERHLPTTTFFQRERPIRSDGGGFEVAEWWCGGMSRDLPQ